MEEPNLIESELSRQITIDGHEFRINICRIDTVPQWSLEVVDENGTSTVWDDLFDTDQAALSEVLRAIKEEGASAFLETDNVVPFPGTS